MEQQQNRTLQLCQRILRIYFKEFLIIISTLTTTKRVQKYYRNSVAYSVRVPSD